MFYRLQLKLYGALQQPRMIDIRETVFEVLGSCLELLRNYYWCLINMSCFLPANQLSPIFFDQLKLQEEVPQLFEQVVDLVWKVKCEHKDIENSVKFLLNELLIDLS